DHRARETLHRISPSQGRPPLPAGRRRTPCHPDESNDEEPMTTFSRALIEVTIAAPADEVWRSLRDKERIAQWVGWPTDSLGAEFDYIFSRATADETKRTLAFGLGDTIEVEPRGAECVLRIVRPAPTADHDWDDIFEDMTQGWMAFLLQLRFATEHH